MAFKSALLKKAERPLDFAGNREEPAEYGDSNNSVECYNAGRARNCQEEIDLDDDDYSEVDTPIGEVYVCGSCTQRDPANPHKLKPYLMTADGQGDLEVIRRGEHHWETGPSVVEHEGKLVDTYDLEDHPEDQ